MAKKNDLGATGEFPDGQLNKNDEGELRLGVGIEGKNVIIDFGKPIEWIGMPKENAIEFANILIANANNIPD